MFQTIVATTNKMFQTIVATKNKIFRTIFATKNQMFYTIVATKNQMFQTIVATTNQNTHFILNSFIFPKKSFPMGDNGESTDDNKKLRRKDARCIQDGWNCRQTIRAS